VAPTAQIGRVVRIDKSIVGEGASVAGDGLYSQSIVWPGAHAHAPQSKSIAIDRDQVVHVRDSD
jgi:hypothetical protein